MWKAVMNYRRNPLNELIKSAEAEMLMHDPSSQEYKTILKNLKQLRKLKADNKPKRLDRNTIFLGGLNLLGILIIVIAERDTVLSQKGCGRSSTRDTTAEEGDKLWGLYERDLVQPPWLFAFFTFDLNF